MAEQVQAILDDMVAPLRDLREREVFSPSEIHAIVDRRRTQEYLLHRRHARPQDFLKYIQDEVQLERLRQLRMNRKKRENPHERREKDDTSSSTKLGDTHIQRHIHFLWKRTLRKFRANQDLYLQYADYLKQQNQDRRLAQLYTQCLQLFPKTVHWWICAASLEYFGTNSSLHNARILLQRGLRVNPNATALWLQSFVLELHVVQKLQGRHAILQPEQETKVDWSIAKLVYDNAMKQANNDHHVAWNFWEQCQYFAETADLQDYIFQSMLRIASDDENSWIAVARMMQKGKDNGTTAIGFIKSQDGSDDDGDDEEEPPSKKQRGSNGTDPVLELIRRATRQIPKATMYLRAIRFLKECHSQLDESNNLLEAYADLVEELFQRSAKLESFAEELCLDHVYHLVQTGRRDFALAYLSDVASKEQDHVSAKFWILWAHLQWSNKDEEKQNDAIRTLERGLERTPMGNKDHMILLLQLLGAYLAKSSRMDELWTVFERIILLSPGYEAQTDLDNETSRFGVHSIADACLQYLVAVIAEKDAPRVRKIYRTIVFHQSLMTSNLSNSDILAYQAVLDASIEFEKMETVSASQTQKPLLQLFERAILFAKGTPLEHEYREQRDSVLFTGGLGVQKSLRGESIVPFVDMSNEEIFQGDLIMELFRQFQVVLVRGVDNRNPKFTWRQLGGLFANLNPDDQSSWCVEKSLSGDVEPKEFLGPFVSSERAYCSFLVQKDRSGYQMATENLPVVAIPGSQLFYEDALWFFFGRNPLSSEGILHGRDEHTDSVSHDGTWHYQLSGTKQWSIRPSSLLIEHLEENAPGIVLKKDESFDIECRQGDLIILNTRLWFHRTVIPAQHFPSVSYARDFHLCRPAPSASGGMTNVDGLYATEHIDAGTIVFRENDMPDCSLHTASADTANCTVVELDSGESAVVSSRDIAPGEFFCVPESDDDDDKEEENDGDDKDETMDRN